MYYGVAVLNLVWGR